MLFPERQYHSPALGLGIGLHEAQRTSAEPSESMYPFTNVDCWHDSEGIPPGVQDVCEPIQEINMRDYRRFLRNLAMFITFLPIDIDVISSSYGTPEH